MGTPGLTWAAEVDTGSGDTRQIIIALIGALALILVALVPVLVNMAKREQTRTSAEPPSPGGATSEETARLWSAIEGVRGEVGEARREHAGLTAQVAEVRVDQQQLSGDLGKLRDAFTRHRWSPGHGHPSNLGPSTDPGI